MDAVPNRSIRNPAWQAKEQAASRRLVNSYRPAIKVRRPATAVRNAFASARPAKRAAIKQFTIILRRTSECYTFTTPPYAVTPMPPCLSVLG